MKTGKLSLSGINAGIWASERPRSDADLVIFSLMNRSLMCAVIRPAPPLNHLIDCWFIVVHKWVTADDDHHLDKPSIPSSIAPYVLDEILTLIGCWAGFELCSHGVFRALTEEESQCLRCQVWVQFPVQINSVRKDGKQRKNLICSLVMKRGCRNLWLTSSLFCSDS